MARSARQPRRFPSPKRLLIQLNLDLEEVLDACIVRYWHQLTYLDRMIVVLEDKRYLRHRGVDWRSVARIGWQSLWRRRRGGASTIEMQFIRTVLDRREKTLARKFNEFILAWLLNFRIDKVSILHSYGSVAFFGSHLDGSRAASMQMFSKLPEQLSMDEAAVVAAMLVYPRPNVENERWRNRVARRANYGISIYRRLEQRGDQITKP